MEGGSAPLPYKAMVAISIQNPLEGLSRVLDERLKTAAGEAHLVRLLAWHLGRHPGLSSRNRLLVAAQAPQARRVRREEVWQKQGHRVSPKAEPILIVAPARYGGFIPYTVYGDHQVEPRPVLKPLEAGIYLPRLRQHLRKDELTDGDRALLRALTRSILGRTQLDRNLAVPLAAWAAEGLSGREGTLTLSVPSLSPKDLYRALLKVGDAVEATARELGLAAEEV